MIARVQFNALYRSASVIQFFRRGKKLYFGAIWYHLWSRQAMHVLLFVHHRQARSRIPKDILKQFCCLRPCLRSPNMAAAVGRSLNNALYYTSLIKQRVWVVDCIEIMLYVVSGNPIYRFPLKILFLSFSLFDPLVKGVRQTPMSGFKHQSSNSQSLSLHVYGYGLWSMDILHKSRIWS